MFRHNLLPQVSPEQILTGQISDSRPPAVPDGMMLQHFVGWEVEAAASAFDPTTAILMIFAVIKRGNYSFTVCHFQIERP